MNGMPCIVTRDLGRYLNEMEAQEAQAEALEAEFESAVADVPEPVAEVIRHWLANQDFSRAIDAALQQIIDARNAP
jgi:hypothetical protein